MKSIYNVWLVSLDCLFYLSSQNILKSNTGVLFEKSNLKSAIEIYKRGKIMKHLKVFIFFCLLGLTFPLRIQALTVSGSGTSSDPYLVSTPAELYAVMSTTSYWNSYIKLGANIDMSSYTCLPIGDYTTGAFTGNFNGNGYVVSNVTITNTSASTNNYLGFFGYTSGATITNLRLYNINVTAQTSSGENRVGGLVGHAENGEINRCGIISGSIAAQGPSTICEYVGGLCGFVHYSGGSRTISECFSNASVSSSSNVNDASAGGLVGRTSEIIVTDCYATGSITFTSASTSTYHAGGIIGFGYYGSVNHCYSRSSISAPSTSFASSATGIAGKVDHTGIYNSFALMDNITGGFQGGGFTFRIAYIAGATLQNNYGKSDMVLSGNTANSYFIGSDNLEGADISTANACANAASAEYYTGSNWLTSTWLIADGIYPKLFGVPEGTSNPTLSSSNSNTSTGVITLTFNENVYIGADGYAGIKIYRSSDDALVYTGDASTVSVSGTIVTVNGTDDFLFDGITYYMLISSNAVHNSTANAFAGVTDKSTITFTMGENNIAKAATNIQYTSFSANWNSVSGATTYYLDVSTSNTFSTFVTGWENVNVGNVTTYSVNSGLSEGITYYYRLRSYTSGTSANSNVISVTTLTTKPVLAGIESASFDYYRNDGPKQITNSITVSDLDDTNIESAVVQISSVYVNDEDELTFTDQNGITGNWNVVTGKLTLSGTATLANYQTALRSVKYLNSNCSVLLVRTISFTINDGDNNSNTITRTINVTNSVPVLINIEEAALNYNAGSGSVEITNSIMVTDDNDTNMESAEISISGNYKSSEDVLTFTDVDGITGNWDVELGILTLYGSSSLANYQAALRSVGYQNTSSTPNTLTRTISFTISDANTNSDTATRLIQLILEETAPELINIEKNPLEYVERADTVRITNTIEISDAEDLKMEGAVIQIVSNYQSDEDSLIFITKGNITGVWNSSTGILALSGIDPLENYQEALRSVKYKNTSNNPNTLQRTICFTVNNGVENSNIASRKIDVVSVNTPPEVYNVEKDSIRLFVEDKGPIALMPKLIITDDDDDLDSIIVSIDKNFIKTEDSLIYKDTLDITGKWDFQKGELKLSGNTLLSNYQTVTRSIYYTNKSNTPDTTLKRIRLLINDGKTNSDTITIFLKVKPVNDKPILSAMDSVLSYTEGEGEIQVAANIIVDDYDDAELDSASAQIAGNYKAGEDILGFTNQNGITGIWNTENGRLILIGNATLANYQLALRSIVYKNTSSKPSPQQRTINFTVNDGDSTSNIVSRELEIISVNDAPIISWIESDTLNYIIKGKGLQIADSIKISDSDDTEIEKALIRISENYQIGEDKMEYDTVSTIVGKWDVDNGVLTLTGAATLEKYEEAIQNVKYCNTFLNTTKAKRKISIMVSDGKNYSNTLLREIIMKGTNSAPIIKEVETDTLKYAKGSDAVVISNSIVTGDPDNYYLFEGIVKIEEGFISGEDKLEFKSVGAIEASFDEGNGVLTFNGLGTVEEYDSTFRSIKYFNAYGIKATTINKEITFIVSDGMEGSNISRRNIGVVSPLPAPSNLTATINGKGNVVLKWKDNSEDEDGFIIEKECKLELNQLLNESPLEKDTVAVNSTEYCDTTVTEICSYFYKVRSYKKIGVLSDVYTDNEKLVFVPMKSPSGLTATAKPEGRIELCWKDNSCVENDYIIERSETDSVHFNILSSIKSNNCIFVDSAIVNGSKYYYRIYAERDTITSCYSNIVSVTGIVTGVLDDLNAVPKEYVLNQNYPNPFNPTTKIKYGIPKAGTVQLKIYNTLGQEVQTLVNKYMEAGIYEVEFNCMNFSSGIYLYRITSGSFSQIKKMILVK
jgi:hypothetical protein